MHWEQAGPRCGQYKRMQSISVKESAVFSILRGMYGIVPRAARLNTLAFTPQNSTAWHKCCGGELHASSLYEHEKGVKRSLWYPVESSKV